MIKFRSTLAASSLLLLSAGAASAADLYSGPRGSMKDDTPINYRACAGSRFAGGYVGANLGVANLHSKWEETYADFNDVFLGSHTKTDSGITGGVEAGYNWVRCNFLVGVATDYNFADVGKTTVYTSPLDGSGVGISNVMKDYVTLRARMGVVADRTLFYVTGGLAWADLHHALHDNYPATVSGNVHYGIAGSEPDFNDWKLGWALGGGFETALTERSRSRVKPCTWTSVAGAITSSTRPRSIRIPSRSKTRKTHSLLASA